MKLEWTQSLQPNTSVLFTVRGPAGHVLRFVQQVMTPELRPLVNNGTRILEADAADSGGWGNVIWSEYSAIYSAESAEQIEAALRELTANRPA